MADKPISYEKLVNADKNADTLGAFIESDENTTVISRLGRTFPSLAKAIKLMIEAGDVVPFPTTELLQAWTPDTAPRAAKALDTGKVYFWGKLSESEIENSWHDTGLSELDRANQFTKQQINALAIEKDLPRPEGLYAILDQKGKVALILDENGTLKAKFNIKQAAVSNGLRINVDSNGLLTEIGLGTKEGIVPIGDCENDGSVKGELSGFLWAVVDKSNKYALAITTEGKVVGNFDFTGLDLGIPKRYRMQQDESSNFQVSTYLDDANLSQLKVFNKSNGITKQLTISGNNVNPKISFDETSVLFTRELDGVSQYVHSPILSSEETIWPVNAPNMIIGREIR